MVLLDDPFADPIAVLPAHLRHPGDIGGVGSPGSADVGRRLQVIPLAASWRGTGRPVPLSPRAHELYLKYSAGKAPNDYLFTNQLGDQLSVSTIRKYPLGFRRHALRHYAASTWLRLGTPVHEVAEYLGDDPRTVLTVYAHVLGEDQRRAHLDRLARAEQGESTGGPTGDLRAPQDPGKL